MSISISTKYLTKDFLTVLPTSRASGLTGSSKMVPSALVTMMRVLSIDDYDIRVIGRDETFSLPSKLLMNVGHSIGDLQGCAPG